MISYFNSLTLIQQKLILWGSWRILEMIIPKQKRRANKSYDLLIRLVFIFKMNKLKQYQLMFLVIIV